MDISAAAFTHCSFVVTRLDRGSIVHDPVAKGSDNLNGGGNTEHILRLCIGDAYSHRFKGLDVGIRSVNYVYKGLARFLGNWGPPLQSYYQFSSDYLNALPTNQRLAELLNRCLNDIIAQRSIGSPYLQNLIGPDDYNCLTDPVDLGCQKIITRTFFGYKVEAGFSAVVGVAVGYQGSDTQAVVDVVYETTETFSHFSPVRKRGTKYLRKMCGLHNLSPSEMQIESINNPDGVTVRGGGFADVFKYTYQGTEVAVKVLKTYANSDLRKIARRFWREAITWKFLRHPNILPMLGVLRAGPQFEYAMVSQWMTGGDINEFIRGNPDVNRFKLLADVAKGLVYAHGEGVVHGDLKGNNILIDQSGNAYLSDFGLTRVLSDPTTLSSCGQGGAVRWMSPELFDPKMFDLNGDQRTESSDCYAFGMLIYEVLSGHVPFHTYPAHCVFVQALEGERPERPQGPEGRWFTDDIWKILEDCWKAKPGDRPRADRVLQRLEEASKFWT